MLTPEPGEIAAYAVDATPTQIASTQGLLERDGYAPVDAIDDMACGVALLRGHLATAQAPQDVLLSRLQRYAYRPRPYLPTGCAARTEFAWIDPARILLGRDGMDSFHHDNSDQHRQHIQGEAPRAEYQRADPVAGIPQFAQRLAAERGHPHGLAEIFGLPALDAPTRLAVGGWWTPAGAVFQVSENGNHRTAAMAILKAPCVLARIDWHGPTFTSRFEDTIASVDDVLAWTDFLRIFQIVAGTGDMNQARAHQGVGLEYPAHTGPFTTKWPILLAGPVTAQKSLAALDALTGTTYTGGVGVLPRSLFDNPRRVRAAMRQLYSTTQEIQATANPRPSALQALRRLFVDH
jgi:hypothetical protein